MTEFQDKARAAETALRDVFPPTPLQRNAHLSERYGADIWLKREDLSPVRSYKLRGAFNAMSKHPQADLFVAASAGNHAQGVAFMCKQLGKRGMIFMPVTTPQQKIQKTRMFGGDQIEIRLIGDYFDDCLKAAQAFCETEGGHFLSPFDDDDVIVGQASVAVEIEDQLGRAPDHLVVPVGGGGLGAGLLGYFGNDSLYTFVEPAGGACLRAALEAGKPVRLPKVNTFADGAAVARIGERPFQRLKDVGLANTLTINEDRLCTTILEMLNVEGIVLEPAGALSVDALKDLGRSIAGRTVVCITSGGNFDFERLPEVKERALRYSGVKKYFILRLPQRPGALRDFLNYLGPDDDIARFEYLKKSARNFGSVLIGIETSDPANFDRLFRALDENGFTYQDITEDETVANFVI
ncbi:threonine ammonia-lyase IlvA [Thalassococcus sp. CAU 1522]|uniref:L-threonine dehydratase n=1 Tax=Thalassococcus arenae TaxID=2851652 RepID=A0ABS6N600_9RHOB|nr:threonine ammonia-lyase IlvA [Thalassococcus arenae]MBV2359448.1 threonine ammonia-lyase IlvA [Thalassococcus arenae]